MNVKWKGSLGLGVVGTFPQHSVEHNDALFPKNILRCRPPCWVITHDYVNINGQRMQSTYGDALKDLNPGSIINMSLSANGILSIAIIGNSVINLEELTSSLPNQVYPVFDLYGKCEKISILSYYDGSLQYSTSIADEEFVATNSHAELNKDTLYSVDSEDQVNVLTVKPINGSILKVDTNHNSVEDMQPSSLNTTLSTNRTTHYNESNTPSQHEKADLEVFEKEKL